MVLTYLIFEFGYFDPYGGDSPGPRYFIPALPFLAVGLAAAFGKWRVITSAPAAISGVASTAIIVNGSNRLSLGRCGWLISKGWVSPFEAAVLVRVRSSGVPECFRDRSPSLPTSKTVAAICAGRGCRRGAPGRTLRERESVRATS
jgi:hypothetical protein